MINFKNFLWNLLSGILLIVIVINVITQNATLLEFIKYVFDSDIQYSTGITDTAINLIGSFVGLLLAVFVITSDFSLSQAYKKLIIINRTGSIYITYFRILIGLLLSITVIKYLSLCNDLVLAEFSMLSIFISTFFILSMSNIQNALFDRVQTIQMALQKYKPKNIEKYGLIEYDSKRNQPIILHKWNNFHSYLDPLGPYQDLFSDAVSTKDRTTLDLYWDQLFHHTSTLIGKKYKNEIGIPSHNISNTSNLFYRVYFYFVRTYYKSNFGEDMNAKVLGTTLHFIIRQSKNLADGKWDIDTIRKSIHIFLLNFLKSVEGNINHQNLVVVAIIKVAEIFKDIEYFGEYEPLMELNEAGFSNLFENCKYNSSEILSHIEMMKKYDENIKSHKESLSSCISNLYSEITEDMQWNNIK